LHHRNFSRQKTVKRLLLAFALACAAAGPAPAAPTESAAASTASVQEPLAAGSGKPIPYKKEEASIGRTAGQSILVLAVLLGLAWGGLMLAKRYLPQLPLALRLKPGSEPRLKLIETMRLGPKASLYLIQLDQKTLLLAQSGDNIAVAATEVGITDIKDHQVA
jgi:flagellar biogenesis protein FliO